MGTISCWLCSYLWMVRSLKLGWSRAWSGRKRYINILQVDLLPIGRLGSSQFTCSLFTAFGLVASRQKKLPMTSIAVVSSPPRRRELERENIVPNSSQTNRPEIPKIREARAWDRRNRVNGGEYWRRSGKDTGPNYAANTCVCSYINMGWKRSERRTWTSYTGAPNRVEWDRNPTVCLPIPLQKTNRHTAIMSGYSTVDKFGPRRREVSAACSFGCCKGGKGCQTQLCGFPLYCKPG